MRYFWYEFPWFTLQSFWTEAGWFITCTPFLICAVLVYKEGNKRIFFHDNIWWPDTGTNHEQIILTKNISKIFWRIICPRRIAKIIWQGIVAQWSRWTPSIIHDSVVLQIILQDNKDNFARKFCKIILQDQFCKIILCKVNSADGCAMVQFMRCTPSIIHNAGVSEIILQDNFAWPFVQDNFVQAEFRRWLRNGPVYQMHPFNNSWCGCIELWGKIYILFDSSCKIILYFGK